MPTPNATDIYLISPPLITDIPSFATTLEAVLDAVTVAAFQLRLKSGGEVAESSRVVQVAEAIFPLLKQRGVVALLNDDPALAAQVGADGVHIGQGDGSVADARGHLGPDAVVGVTCHTSRDLAFAAAKAGADYVAFGAFHPTPTKTPPEMFEGDTGLELLKWWHEAMTTPCVAIGGITAETAGPIARAGADFVAVSSAIWSAPDAAASARSLSEALL